MSKHGVLGLTKADAKDYAADGIRVNAISPGWVKTEINRTLWDSSMASRSDCSKGSRLPLTGQRNCGSSANGSMGFARRDCVYC